MEQQRQISDVIIYFEAALPKAHPAPVALSATGTGEKQVTLLYY
jgi:hypothetical protein